MQQRVMIAIALSCDPALLIADNPTTALDVTIQIQILDLVKQLRDRLGMAVLMDHPRPGGRGQALRPGGDHVRGQGDGAGPVYAVLKQPRHPYTRRLIDALPKLGAPSSGSCRSRAARPIPRTCPRGARSRRAATGRAPECEASDVPAGRDRRRARRPLPVPGGAVR